MKKTLFAVALATAGLVAIPSAFAQDQDQSAVTGSKAKQGWYLDGDLGYSYTDKSKPYNKKSNYAGALTGGYRWAVSDELSAGVELGYVYLGKFKARDGVKHNYYALGGDGETRSSLRGATLGGALRWNFIPQWYISLRAGAFDAHGSGLSDSEFPVRRSFSNNIGYYAGVGTGWDINDHWSVGVNYTYYGVHRSQQHNDPSTRFSLDTQTFTVGGEYRF